MRMRVISTNCRLTSALPPLVTMLAASTTIVPEQSQNPKLRPDRRSPQRRLAACAQQPLTVADSGGSGRRALAL
jgi:hypothetical protein